MRAATGDFMLPVDKPEGPTSHDVVAAARKALRTRRVGHTGTLDPFASGLLVLCVGRATRLAEYLSGLDKRYVATARLGTETDTLDREGEVTATSEAWTSLGEVDVRRELERLRGSIQQIPPQFSAKKIGGEAMHKKARRGERVELEPVAVTVYEIELLEAALPLVRFAVRCSSGTYVRSLARDLGKGLGVGAHLVGLRRESVGRFDVRDALGLDDLASEDAVRAAAIEPVEALAHLPSVEVDEDLVGRLRNGQRIRLPVTPERGGPVSVSRAGDLVAIGEVHTGVLRPKKVFVA